VIAVPEELLRHVLAAQVALEGQVEFVPLQLGTVGVEAAGTLPRAAMTPIVQVHVKPEVGLEGNELWMKDTRARRWSCFWPTARRSPSAARRLSRACGRYPATRPPTRSCRA